MDDFRILYERYQKEVYHFILRMVNYQTDLAEELTQETFYQTYISLKNYKEKCSIRTWIFAIAKNTCFRYFKKNPIMDDINDPMIHEEMGLQQGRSAEEIAIMNTQYKEVMRKIIKMEKKYRDVLIYRSYFELSFKEIAAMMHITENSAKVLFCRAKKKL